MITSAPPAGTELLREDQSLPVVAGPRVSRDHLMASATSEHENIFATPGQAYRASR